MPSHRTSRTVRSPSASVLTSRSVPRASAATSAGVRLQGVGFLTNSRAPEAGFSELFDEFEAKDDVGLKGTLSLKGSTANIDELPGWSLTSGVSGRAGLGLDAGRSVTRDGEHVATSLGVGPGVSFGACVGQEYSHAGRWLDWDELCAAGKRVLAPGEAPRTDAN